MGIPIIHIITIMGISLMVTFRSIMISMAFIISIMMVTLTVTSVVILMAATTVVVMVGEGALDRQTKAGPSGLVFWGELEECSLFRSGSEKKKWVFSEKSKEADRIGIGLCQFSL